MGTLVGNIVNAMPAADGATALIALGEMVKVLVERSLRQALVRIHPKFTGI